MSRKVARDESGECGRVVGEWGERGGWVMPCSGGGVRCH